MESYCISTYKTVFYQGMTIYRYEKLKDPTKNYPNSKQKQKNKTTK